MTNRLLTEHGWSEVVKITGKSRKKYELSITNAEADLKDPLILYPQKVFVSYPLSLKIFVHVFLIPKTPNRPHLFSECFSLGGRGEVAGIELLVMGSRLWIATLGTWGGADRAVLMLEISQMG